MRKGLCMLMTLMCLLVFSCSALAAGTTVTTFTPFADMDFAAQGYMDIVTAWEEETGNIVEDYSGLQDDLFLQQMTDMVSGGTADIVVVPVGSGSADSDEEGGSDPMLKQAVEVVIDAGQASTSLLQRRCKLGYARAARIMDEMEEKGIIGPYEGAKPRAVLISRQQWLEMQMNQPDE